MLSILRKKRNNTVKFAEIQNFLFRLKKEMRGEPDKEKWPLVSDEELQAEIAKLKTNNDVEDLRREKEELAEQVEKCGGPKYIAESIDIPICVKKGMEDTKNG